MDNDGKCIFIDITLCTACRGCMVACKEWNHLLAERTMNQGSMQNPEDLSFYTWKLVRFKEIKGTDMSWHFFSDQCRHCINPPCKEQADIKAKGLITQDEQTGAVIVNKQVKIDSVVFKDIRDACPFDIPRINPDGDSLSFCNMCIERIRLGLVPACVKTCSTGATAFGSRKNMLELANKRLGKLKASNRKAILTNSEDVRVIYLIPDDAEVIYKHAVADKPFVTKESK